MLDIELARSSAEAEPQEPDAGKGAKSRRLGDAILAAEFLGRSGSSVGVRALSRALNMPLGRAHRLLQAMKTERLVVQDPVDGSYRLGLRIVELAQSFLGQFDVKRAAMPFLEELRNVSGESVGLMVQEEFDRVCVASVDSREALRIALMPGARTPIHCGASGRVLLAGRPAEFFAAMLRTAPLRSFTPHTIVDPVALSAVLQRVREAGYETSDGERQLGVRSVAVPVRSARGDVIAAIALYGPSARFTQELAEAFVGPMRAASERISAVLVSGTAADEQQASRHI